MAVSVLWVLLFKSNRPVSFLASPMFSSSFLLVLFCCAMIVISVLIHLCSGLYCGCNWQLCEAAPWRFFFVLTPMRCRPPVLSRQDDIYAAEVQISSASTCLSGKGVLRRGRRVGETDVKLIQVSLRRNKKHFQWHASNVWDVWVWTQPSLTSKSLGGVWFLCTLNSKIRSQVKFI